MAEQDRKVEMDSKERVAFDLMLKIAYCDDEPSNRDREYWFNLYYNCQNAVISGWSYKDIQREG